MPFTVLRPATLMLCPSVQNLKKLTVTTFARILMFDVIWKSWPLHDICMMYLHDIFVLWSNTSDCQCKLYCKVFYIRADKKKESAPSFNSIFIYQGLNNKCVIVRGWQYKYTAAFNLLVIQRSSGKQISAPFLLPQP